MVKNLKPAFTMIEIVITIVIMGILAGGTYISLSKLMFKSSKSKAISQLSFDSTLITNQVSALLSNRVSATVIGYDPSTSSMQSIYKMDSLFPIIEWISTDFDSYREEMYSGLVDFDRCDKAAKLIYSPSSDINATNRALIFAGSFDEGGIIYSDDFNDSFGWHNHNHTEIFPLSAASTNNDIILQDTPPDTLYEKYYLVDTAYAIAKYKDINKSASCISDLDTISTLNDNSLLLFFNYQPWESETFCADPETGGATIDGNVTLLSNEVKGYEVLFSDNHLQFNITLERTIPKDGKKFNISISKQKVIF